MDYRALLAVPLAALALSASGAEKLRVPDGWTAINGNHWPDGFLLAAGPQIRPGTKLENAHIFDLMPTVYELLDLETPQGLHGKSLLPDLDRSDDVS